MHNTKKEQRKQQMAMARRLLQLEKVLENYGAEEVCEQLEHCSEHILLTTPDDLYSSKLGDGIVLLLQLSKAVR